jgi:hypothetical protein
VRGRDANNNCGAFTAIFLTVSLAQTPSVGTFEPNGGSGSVGQAEVLTTTYSDPNGYEDIVWAFFFLDRVPPIASGGLTAAYHRPMDTLWLMNGGTCQPGEATSLSNTYATLDCSGTVVSGVGDTLSISWLVRPEQCFDESCGWNYAVELVGDSTGQRDAGLVGWWRLNPAGGGSSTGQRDAGLVGWWRLNPAGGGSASPATKPMEGDLKRLREEIEAWQSELGER